MPQPPSSSRRRFLTGLAAGAALAPFAGLVARRPSPLTPPTDICTTGKTLLTPADFTYQGLFKMTSESGHRMRYSRGCLTGRRVGGVLRLLMSGRSEAVDFAQHSVYELSIPTGLTSSIASAPRTTVLNEWVDICGGKALLQVGQAYKWGLHWDDTTNALWWAYSADYAGQPHNPAIGATVLGSAGAVTVSGAWRTSVHSAAACGYMLPIPDWFRPYVGGARLGIGNPPHVNNALSSFGANLHTFTPPSLAAPADAVGNEAARTIQTTALLFHAINHPQARTANYKTCGWNVPYDDSQGGRLLPGEPWFGGIESGTLLDWMDSCAWIDLPTKHGILFLGQLADTIPGRSYTNDVVTHLWYGKGTCIHGQAAPVHAATGPGAGSLVNQAWMYDPLDLIPVAQGAKTSYQVTPQSTFRASALGGFVPVERLNLYQFGGAYFDIPTGKLYLAEVNAYQDGYDFLPIIHVFQVA